MHIQFTSMPWCQRERELEGNHATTLFTPSGCQHCARVSVRCLFHVLAIDPSCRITFELTKCLLLIGAGYD